MTRVFKLNPKTLFQLFIFLLPTQLGYHFWPQWAYVFGIRVDYLAPTIFLTDILFVAALFLFLKNAKRAIRENLFKLVLAVGLMAAVNIFFSSDFYPALFKWFKVMEVAILAFVVAKQKGFGYKSWLARPLFFSAAAFSLIGIAQVLRGGTIGGLLFYLGERSFNTLTPGIALWSPSGQLILRAYSTFSHPNSLAGYLGVVLILTLPLVLKGKVSKILLPTTFFIVTTFLLTASLSATASLAIVFLGFLLLRGRERLLRGISAVVVILAVLCSMLMPLFAKAYLKDVGALGENLSRRLSLSVGAGSMFSERPFFGVGLNNFINWLPKVNKEVPFVWWLQPVHNVFLLSLAESGIAGTIIFLVTIQMAISKGTAGNKTFVVLAILFMILTGLTDHYWLTLQQNQLLGAVVLGLAFRKKDG